MRRGVCACIFYTKRIFSTTARFVSGRSLQLLCVFFHNHQITARESSNGSSSHSIFFIFFGWSTWNNPLYKVHTLILFKVLNLLLCKWFFFWSVEISWFSHPLLKKKKKAQNRRTSLALDRRFLCLVNSVWISVFFWKDSLCIRKCWEEQQ